VRFRPARVVRVTSKEELDSALASADQVIVEGDDRLLSYAVTKAARDAPLSNVDIQMRGRLIYVAENAVTGDSNTTSSNCAERTEEPWGPPPPPPRWENPPPGQEAFRNPVPPPSLHAPAFARKTSYFHLLLGLFIVVVLLGTLWYFVVPKAGRPVPPITSANPSPAVPGIPGNLPLAPDSQGDPLVLQSAEILQSLAWPTVAIVAILALYFIARQAIAGGRNVEIHWKVTENVTGRVVITKVRSRADKTGPAAA
jgi:hypothetical protein